MDISNKDILMSRGKYLYTLSEKQICKMSTTVDLYSDTYFLVSSRPDETQVRNFLIDQILKEKTGVYVADDIDSLQVMEYDVYAQLYYINKTYKTDTKLFVNQGTLEEYFNYVDFNKELVDGYSSFGFYDNSDDLADHTVMAKFHKSKWIFTTIDKLFINQCNNFYYLNDNHSFEIKELPRDWLIVNSPRLFTKYKKYNVHSLILIFNELLELVNSNLKEHLSPDVFMARLLYKNLNPITNKSVMNIYNNISIYEKYPTYICDYDDNKTKFEENTVRGFNSLIKLLYTRLLEYLEKVNYHLNTMDTIVLAVENYPNMKRYIGIDTTLLPKNTDKLMDKLGNWRIVSEF